VKRLALRVKYLLVVLAVPLLVTSSAAAWNPFGALDNSCKNASDSAVCQDRGKGGKNPLTGNDGIVMNVINILAVVAGIAAVIIIVLAGLKMVQASGSTDDIASARRTIIYAIVGLVVIVLSRSLLALVLSKL